MRNEQEMYNLILGYALSDERVRAVILDSSRADPSSPRDPFQDYDVMYLVTDVESYKRNPDWINVFGERMILQLPDDMVTAPPGREGYAYLMQFMDSNRIDLTLYPVASLDKLKPDGIRRVLLDKDGIVDIARISDDRAYIAHAPTEKEYADCCNEFWWVAPYAAKGLWRDQVLYARFFIDDVLHEELLKMLKWYIAVKSGGTAAPGKFGKYYREHLEPELWALLLKTYSDADEEHTWEALFTMCGLFRRAAVSVACRLGFEYPAGDDERVSAFLRRIRALDRKATSIS